ncbi:hypothetical protein ID866_11949 [Astraeus odoratus]|nr:hypothetical protein ID866_12285 [Astraeus odoratus]KAG6327140.1 hypothetical protein ID866_11949 [Astraeus odoratus]
MFDLSVSIVSRWMDKGNARDCVKIKPEIGPRPLVSLAEYLMDGCIHVT